MGYMKEPEGVDFIIKSEPLTEEDKKQISQFIREYKRASQIKKEKSLLSKKKKNTAPNTMQPPAG